MQRRLIPDIAFGGRGGSEQKQSSKSAIGIAGGGGEVGWADGRGAAPHTSLAGATGKMCAVARLLLSVRSETDCSPLKGLGAGSVGGGSSVGRSGRPNSTLLVTESQDKVQVRQKIAPVFRTPVFAASRRWSVLAVFKVVFLPSELRDETACAKFLEVQTTVGHRSEDPSYSFARNAIPLARSCPRRPAGFPSPPRSQPAGRRARGRKTNSHCQVSTHVGPAVLGGVAGVWAAMLQRTPGVSPW